MYRILSSKSLTGKAIRATAALLALSLVPSAMCSVAQLPDRNWTSPLARLASTDEKSVIDAIRLVQDGDGSLALVRLDGSKRTGRGVFSALRQLTAYVVLEVAHGFGVLPASPIVAQCPYTPHA